MTIARFSFLPPDSYDHRGVDGQGRNRLRLEVVTPARRCSLLPLTYEAAWESEHRPEHSRQSWASFAPCTGNACETCPISTAKKVKPFGPTVVREDEQGRVWLMNRREGGWAEFGHPYKTWGALLAAWDVTVGARGRDGHGVYFEVTSAEREAETSRPLTLSRQYYRRV